MKLASFESLAAAFDAAGVRYLVAGGLAVGAHGYLRFTKHIDIVVQLIPDNIERAFTALASLGYRPIVPITMKQFSNSELRESWIRDKGMQGPAVLERRAPRDFRRRLRHRAVRLR